MEILLLLTCFLVTLIIGWSVIGIIFAKSVDLSFLEKLSFSFGAGIGAVAVEMHLYYFFGLRHTPAILLAPWIPVVIAGAIYSGKRQGLSRQASGKLSLFEKCLIGGISFEVLITFFRALLKPLESFDSIAMYAMRSKIIFTSGMIPANFFSEIVPKLPNPDYPLLVPLAEVWVYNFLGNLNDLFVKALFPLFLLALLIAFFCILKRFISRKGALIFTFILASVPQFNKFATVGYADLILTYYYTISLVSLFVWIKEAKPGFLILSGIFSGFAILTKNEGMALTLVNVILLSIFLIGKTEIKKSKLIKQSVIFLLCIGLISAPWLCIRSANGLENDLLEFKGLGKDRLTEAFGNLDRIPIILYEYQKQFFGPKKWNIVWIIFLTLLALGIKESFRGDLKYFSLSVFLALFFYGCVYILVPYDGPINWHIASGVSRLFIHFMPAAVFFIALTCKRGNLVEGI